MAQIKKRRGSSLDMRQIKVGRIISTKDPFTKAVEKRVVLKRTSRGLIRLSDSLTNFVPLPIWFKVNGESLISEHGKELPVLKIRNGGEKLVEEYIQFETAVENARKWSKNEGNTLFEKYQSMDGGFGLNQVDIDILGSAFLELGNPAFPYFANHYLGLGLDDEMIVKIMPMLVAQNVVAAAKAEMAVEDNMEAAIHKEAGVSFVLAQMLATKR